jgi:hypothetical protein
MSAKKPGLPMRNGDMYFEPVECKMPKGNAYLFWLQAHEIKINDLGDCRFVACDDTDKVLGAFESVGDAFIGLHVKGYNVEFGLKIK